MDWTKPLYIPIQSSKLVIPQSAYKNADPGRIKQEEKPQNPPKEVRPAVVDPSEFLYNVAKMYNA